jgi:hypothetical protein
LDHFVSPTPSESIADRFIDVRFQKRAHNPPHLAAGFDTTDVPVPWPGSQRPRLRFGSCVVE